MPYTPLTWADKPERTTPVNAERLRHMETQYEEAVADANAYTDGAIMLRGKPGTHYQMVACTIRRIDATTWAALDDAGHAPTGVASVVKMADRVRINYDFTASKVGSLTATPDESFAAAGSGGVRVGSSVGTSYADVFFYIGTSSTPVDPGTLSTAGANVWVLGFFEVAG